MAGIKDMLKEIKISNKEDADVIDAIKDRSKITTLPLDKKKIIRLIQSILIPIAKKS